MVQLQISDVHVTPNVLFSEPVPSSEYIISSFRVALDVNSPLIFPCLCSFRVFDLPSDLNLIDDMISNHIFFWQIRWG